MLRACDVLDDPQVTKERLASMRQICAVIADSYLATIRASIGETDIVNGWPRPDGAPPEMVIGYELALHTLCFIDSAQDVGRTSEWARKHRAHVVSEWVAARRAAEEFAYGSIKASTLVGLDRAERDAAGLVAGIASVAMRDKAAPRVESPDESRPTT